MLTGRSEAHKAHDAARQLVRNPVSAPPELLNRNLHLKEILRFYVQLQLEKHSVPVTAPSFLLSYFSFFLLFSEEKSIPKMQYLSPKSSFLSDVCWNRLQQDWVPGHPSTPLLAVRLQTPAAKRC